MNEYNAVCLWCGEDDDKWKSFLDELGYRRDRNYYFNVISVGKLLCRARRAEIVTK